MQVKGYLTCRVKRLFITLFCEEPRERHLVIIYFINSVIYFLTFFICEDPGKGF